MAYLLPDQVYDDENFSFLKRSSSEHYFAGHDYYTKSDLDRTLGEMSEPIFGEMSQNMQVICCSTDTESSFDLGQEKGPHRDSDGYAAEMNRLLKSLDFWSGEDDDSKLIGKNFPRKSKSKTKIEYPKKFLIRNGIQPDFFCQFENIIQNEGETQKRKKDRSTNRTKDESNVTISERNLKLGSSEKRLHKIEKKSSIPSSGASGSTKKLTSVDFKLKVNNKKSKTKVKEGYEPLTTSQNSISKLHNPGKTNFLCFRKDIF
jgi:hypothetical protein